MPLRFVKIRSDYLATLIGNAQEDLALAGNLTDTYRARLSRAIAGGKAALKSGRDPRSKLVKNGKAVLGKYREIR